MDSRTRVVAAGGAMVVVLAVGGSLLTARAIGSGRAAPQPTPSATPAPTPTPQACSTTRLPLLPTAVTIPGLGPHVSVIALHRNSHGTPGVPPLSSTGKTEMAFDLGSGIRPGDPHGNALLNAHTWPDGTALGNKLLAGLHDGDQIVVHGLLGQICYRVTDRVEVPATDPGKRYYATTGPPQIAIAVCSGKRLGPGLWTKRTLWFASPIA